MKGYELMKKIANEEIKENSEFKIRTNEGKIWNERIRYEANDLVFRETIETNEEGNLYGRDIFRLWNLKSVLEMEFELMEENKEIEEYKTKYTERCIDVEVRNEINELVRAVNKLIKESEEK